MTIFDLRLPVLPNGLLPGAQTTDQVKLSFLRWLASGDTERREDYVMFREFYEGRQNVELTDRVRAFLDVDKDTDFRMNFVPIPVEILAERLNVSGFDVGEEMGTGAGGQESDESTDMQRLGGDDGLLQEWWTKSGMDLQQGNVHEAAIRDADSFVIVEWDSDAGRPKFSFELAYDGLGSSGGVDVVYDDEMGDIKYAVKYWVSENAVEAGSVRRANVYFPDAIYKYVSDSRRQDGDWIPFEVEGEEWPIPWLDTQGEPLGVPVMHFKNNSGGYDFGRSEIDDIVPIQRALNKSVIDLLAGADVEGFGLITLTGGKQDDEFTVAPRQILGTSNPAASWGYIPAGDLQNLIRVVDHFVMKMAQRSRTPLAYFQITGQVASSETQKADDTGLVSKATKRSVEFGKAWADVMHMAVKLANTFGSASLNEDLLIKTVWASFERVDKRATMLQEAQIVTALVQAGATLEGALAVVDWPDDIKEKLLRGDMVDLMVDDLTMPSDDELRNVGASMLPAGDGSDTEAPENLDTTAGLNGAQIRAVLDVLDNLRSGVTPPIVAVELLIAVGMTRERAQRIVDSIPERNAPEQDRENG